MSAMTKCRKEEEEIKLMRQRSAKIRATNLCLSDNADHQCLMDFRFKNDIRRIYTLVGWPWITNSNVCICDPIVET